MSFRYAPFQGYDNLSLSERLSSPSEQSLSDLADGPPVVSRQLRFDLTDVGVDFGTMDTQVHVHVDHGEDGHTLCSDAVVQAVENGLRRINEYQLPSCKIPEGILCEVARAIATDLIVRGMVKL